MVPTVDKTSFKLRRKVQHHRAESWLRAALGSQEDCLQTPGSEKHSSHTVETHMWAPAWAWPGDAAALGPPGSMIFLQLTVALLPAPFYTTLFELWINTLTTHTSCLLSTISLSPLGTDTKLQVGSSFWFKALKYGNLLWMMNEI